MTEKLKKDIEYEKIRYDLHNSVSELGHKLNIKPLINNMILFINNKRFLFSYDLDVEVYVLDITQYSSDVYSLPYDIMTFKTKDELFMKFFEILKIEDPQLLRKLKIKNII